MLRVELSPNGAFNITEFGTREGRAQFKALYAYSPYHHVARRAAIPPILMTTGANDPRVDAVAVAQDDRRAPGRADGRRADPAPHQ